MNRYLESFLITSFLYLAIGVAFLYAINDIKITNNPVVRYRDRTGGGAILSHLISKDLHLLFFQGLAILQKDITDI